MRSRRVLLAALGALLLGCQPVPGVIGGDQLLAAYEEVSAPVPRSSATIVCPVPGSAFTDTWGAPRSGGRSHQGVDMLAIHGTPVLAPVDGTVLHRNSSLGGLSFHLEGADGAYYFGTHMSAYGQSGPVAAGTVIGYVGDSGNAAGTPHLHFEYHPVRGQPVNPTPVVTAACG